MPEVRVVVPRDMDRALEALVRAGFAGNKAELVRAALTHFLSVLPTQIPRGYDLETAFSPDGRIFQLEYAEECIDHGGTIVGVCCNEGVVLAKEVYVEPLPLSVTPNPFIKIFKICDRIGLVHSGLLFDGHLAAREAIKQAELIGKEGTVNIETLVEELYLFMQSYSQRKDVRPLGTALLVGGIDLNDKPRLFLLKSSGLAREYKACAAGVGSREAEEILKRNYRTDLSLEEAVILAIKATLRKRRRPEDVLVATIDTKTKKFRELTLEDKKNLWDKIFL